MPLSLWLPLLVSLALPAVLFLKVSGIKACLHLIKRFVEDLSRLLSLYGLFKHVQRWGRIFTADLLALGIPFVFP